jgi:DNA-binding MarR family transcriptional regulator/ribosomal protein S18 acetylase RimI-like enzyme
MIIANTIFLLEDYSMREILREIGMIARCFESIANIEFKDYNLAKNQYIYLVRICENPGTIQERVADLLKVDRSTASRAIEKLKNSGYIVKQNDKYNKKNIKLYPTKLGNEVYSMLKSDEEHSNHVALNGFTDKELSDLLKQLQKIRKNIQPDWELVKNGGNRLYPQYNKNMIFYEKSSEVFYISSQKYEIIEYQDKYIDQFKKISYEWLEKYVSIEPADELILNNPRKVIIDNGGYIFLIRLNDKIIGTISLIKTNETTFELAKLAVTKKYQGKNIGKKLIEFAIRKSLTVNAKKLILYTNDTLKTAIYLYRRFGFKEIKQETQKYIEGNIKMELELTY